MKTKLEVYNKSFKPFYSKNDNESTLNNFGILNHSTTILPEILFITSFPPRECGIATYSQDLINALTNQFSNSFSCSICALESDTENHIYKNQPKYILNTDIKNSFAKIAFEINKNDNIGIVVMQHEFGFFAKKEFEYSMFMKSINKPIIFVFHTVLPNPNIGLKYKVQDLVMDASMIIVMTKSASKILIDEYGVSPSKITIIPHGTHLIKPLNKNELKQKYNLSGKKILSTFGLLSANKGIEVTLKALPSIIVDNPNVKFLILGKTHPTVVKYDGEIYRKSLESLVLSLNIKENVQFVNEYLPLPILLEYLQLTDIYLFTSNDPNQAVSGTFSYAMSAGCPIISTPIPHAKELLNKDTGLFFDFENSKQLADSVLLLLNNQSLTKNISLNALHQMAPTAWENSAIAHAKLFESFLSKKMILKYNIPPINLKHIKNMTTTVGMLQFSKIAQPDIESGYTLDDNARALIVICQLYKKTKDEKYLVYLKTYFQFINQCVQPNGKFINYIDKHKKITIQNDQENLDDSNGRAIWAIGFLLSLKPILPNIISDEAELLITKVLPNLEHIRSTRSMAFIIKGLYYLNDEKHIPMIELFADRLVQMYRHERKNNWYWFEHYLTYGNSVLPESLLYAYIRTNKKTYKIIAKESFNFLLDQVFIDNRIKVISNKGWKFNNQSSQLQIGGEQPIDIAYTIMALEKFYLIFKDKSYIQKAKIAFNWFLGENHLKQIVYNPCTGGCYDGVEEYNVNLNQGAESSLSYLLARLVIEKIIALEKNSILIASKQY